MKSLIKVLLLVEILFLFQAVCFSQTPVGPTCLYDFTPVPNGDDETRVSDCIPNSPEYINYYGRYQFYLDNFDDRPVITIPININIWQLSDGTGNWTEADTNDIKQIFIWLKDIYEFNCNFLPNQISGVVPRPNTKINLQLNSINFIPSSTTLYTTTNGYALNNFAELNGYPDIKKYLNIHFTYGYIQDASGHSNTTVSEPWVVSWWHDLNYALARHLAHEVAHNFDLYHTYGDPSDATQPSGSESNNINNVDFLDDVFDINGFNWCGATTGFVCYQNSCTGVSLWECLEDCSVPYCTNNVMGGTKDACYFSPKQIAKMHRALSLKPVRGIVKCEEYFVDPIEIIANETWDFDIKLYNPVVVKSGVTLTIQCKVAFASNHQIIVEPGGKLVLDGGILTSHCEKWEGVELRGNSNLSQNFPNQGTIELKNDAIIENATIGIRTVAVSNGIPDWTTTGGIIKATGLSGTNCTFKNCRKGIEISSYHFYNPTTGIEAKNVSRIYNCNFITDDDYPYDPQNNFPYAGIVLYDNNGINIVNCLFENQRTDLANITVNKRGSGIITLDAGYSVGARYNLQTGNKIAGTENTFKNLYYGVSTGTGVQGTFSNIKDNIFENNAFGVLLDVGIWNLVARNSFTIPGADLSVPGYNYSFGVYSEFASNFNVEENTFTNVIGNLSPNQAIFSVNSVGPYSQFYRNTVTGITFGTQTSGYNQELKIDCNTYNKGTNSTIDIHHASGVLGTQGSCSPFGGIPVKNLFNGTCNNSNISEVYKNPSASPFFYKYKNGTLNTSCHNLGVYATLCNSTLNNNCPNTITNFAITPFPLKISLLKSAITQINQTVADKKTVIDNNNTLGLLNLISTASPGIVKNGLLNASPYLSDEVLMAYLNTNPPNGNLKQVVIANSPVTEIIKEKIDNMNLPNGIKNQIDAVQTGISARNELEADIQVLTTNKNLELNDLTRIYLDTNWIDSAIVYLKQEGSIEAICALVPIQISKDTTDTKTQIELIKYEATCLEQKDPNCPKAAELRTFCELHEALLKILYRPGKYLSMTSSEISYLESIAIGTNSPAAHARAILKFKNENYPILSGEYANFLHSMYIEQTVNENNEVYTFEISPNPTNGIINIKINTEELESPSVVITDINGRIVKLVNIQSDLTKVEFNGLSEGTYLTYLVRENKIFGTKKIIYAK